MERRDYQVVLRRYREQLRLSQVGLESLGGRGAGHAGLRQTDVDMLLRGGVGVYGKVEGGRLVPSPDLLRRIAEVLKFSEHDLRIAHLDLFGTAPVLPAEVPSPFWRQVLDGQREMACAVTPGGRLIGANDAFAEMFTNRSAPAGQRPPASAATPSPAIASADVLTNMWRWALSPSARGVLLGWRRQWAPHLLALLKLARHQFPDDSVLRTVYADLLDDPVLRQITEANDGLGDGARPFRHTTRGKGTARIMIAWGPGVSIVTILFEADK